MSAKLELFSFIASTADGLQVGAALLTKDSGLFQRLAFSCMYKVTLTLGKVVFRFTTNILQNTTRGVKGF
ncbi:hypothetical protein [Nostoc sp.]|uniref:hypothetical protein n=1 Tax=Nostoc sp. TaxID=1180 RepID=UPI002FF5E860